jgi:hypothetical protein
MSAFFFANSFYFKFISWLGIFIQGTLQMSNFDFIVNDYSGTMPSPDQTKAVIQFMEDSPAMEEWEYDQFLRMRKAINRIFNDPYHVTCFADDIGRGYTANIMDRQTPTDLVWNMLEEYIRAHGWQKLIQRGTGFIKTVTTNKNMVTDRSHDQVYQVKLYTALTREIQSCPEYDHQFVPEAQRTEVERLVGTCGYCAEYDRCILNQKQVDRLKELGYVSV